MATATPNWTDNVSVIAAATLAAGNKARGTIDLRSKFGAFLFVRLGRKGSTAPGSAIQALARRVLNNDGAGGIHPASPMPLSGSLPVLENMGASDTKRHGSFGRVGRHAASSSVAPIAPLLGLPASSHRIRPSRPASAWS